MYPLEYYSNFLTSHMFCHFLVLIVSVVTSALIIYRTGPSLFLFIDSVFTGKKCEDLGLLRAVGSNNVLNDVIVSQERL